MSNSKCEEIIACLWLISAMLAIMNDMMFAAAVLLAKFFLDLGCCFYAAFKEIADRKKENQTKKE